MDISIIRQAIVELENDDITLNNVIELASLYIIVDRYDRRVNEADNTVVEHELQDIFPYYSKYIDIKRKYQLKQVTERQLDNAMKDLCREICEFLNVLYNSSEMAKERKYIREMLRDCLKKYDNS